MEGIDVAIATTLYKWYHWLRWATILSRNILYGLVARYPTQCIHDIPVRSWSDIQHAWCVVWCVLLYTITHAYSLPFYHFNKIFPTYRLQHYYYLSSLSLDWWSIISIKYFLGSLNVIWFCTWIRLRISIRVITTNGIHQQTKGPNTVFHQLYCRMMSFFLCGVYLCCHLFILFSTVVTIIFVLCSIIKHQHRIDTLDRNICMWICA